MYLNKPGSVFEDVSEFLKFFQARYLNFQNNFNDYDCLDQTL